MRIARHFTREGLSPYDSLAFTAVSSEIRNPDGSVVFRLDEFEAPAAWSQVACDVLAQKYAQGRGGAQARTRRGDRRPRVAVAAHPRRKGP